MPGTEIISKKQSTPRFPALKERKQSPRRKPTKTNINYNNKFYLDFENDLKNIRSAVFDLKLNDGEQIEVFDLWKKIREKSGRSGYIPKNRLIRILKCDQAFRPYQKTWNEQLGDIIRTITTFGKVSKNGARGCYYKYTFISNNLPENTREGQGIMDEKESPLIERPNIEFPISQGHCRNLEGDPSTDSENKYTII